MCKDNLFILHGNKIYYFDGIHYLCRQSILIIMSGKLYLEEHGERLLNTIGMTKAEFARRIGIHKQNVNSVFTTKSVIVIRKISDVLGVPFELLVSYKEEPDYTGCIFYSDFVLKAKYIRIVLPYFRGDELFAVESLNGEIPADDVALPLYDEENKQFDFTINLEDAHVCDWSYDSKLRLRAKVRDSGTYMLLGSDRCPLLQISGYVPEGVIPPLERNWGDYVDFYIDNEGLVENWPSEPDLMFFASKGTLPKPIESNKWSRAEMILDRIRNERLSSEELSWIKSHI